jgi:hypothetical protein
MTATLTYPTLDSFLAALDEIYTPEDVDTADFGTMEAFLLTMLFRWEAEDSGLTIADARMKELCDDITLISKAMTDEERLATMTHLVTWQAQEGWLSERVADLLAQGTSSAWTA